MNTRIDFTNKEKIKILEQMASLINTDVCNSLCWACHISLNILYPTYFTNPLYYNSAYIIPELLTDIFSNIKTIAKNNNGDPSLLYWFDNTDDKVNKNNRLRTIDNYIKLLENENIIS